MIGPGATRGDVPGGAVGISGTGRPAALKAAAITMFDAMEMTGWRQRNDPVGLLSLEPQTLFGDRQGGAQS